jgi:hypothetical protein
MSGAAQPNVAQVLSTLLQALLGWAPVRAAQSRLKAWGVTGRMAVVTVPYLWLLVFFLVPFFIVLKISFSSVEIAMPPFAPLIQWADDKVMLIRLNLGNYQFLWEDALYSSALLNSLKMAGVSTVLALLVGYPMAYGIARSSREWRNILLMLVMLPFWTSFLLRVYAWIGLLGVNSPVNQWLLAMGLIDEPVSLLGRLHRYRLQLSAIHGVAVVHGHREAGRYLAGSSCRPRLPPHACLLQRHVAPHQGRHRRWLHAGLHSRHRRVRHSCAAWRAGLAHDRPRALGRVLQ